MSALTISPEYDAREYDARPALRVIRVPEQTARTSVRVPRRSRSDRLEGPARPQLPHGSPAAVARLSSCSSSRSPWA